MKCREYNKDITKKGDTKREKEEQNRRRRKNG